MDEYGYGLWLAVIVNSAVFIIFAASFFHPATRRDWRALGGFSAFVVALFTEMYGVPLTIYLLSGPLGSTLDLDLTHNRGHIWSDLVGWGGDPHVSPFHIASYFFIIGGFWLIAAAWRVLYDAQRTRQLAVTGAYRWVRHPQYAGFLAIMVGFLLQWPTILTMLMFPVLVLVYRRLAIAEEREVRADHPGEWERYAAVTPRFVPRRHSRPRAPRPRGNARSAA